MRLLRKKAHQPQHRPAESSILDKAAHAVASSILNWQKKAARLLGRKFTALSRRARLCSFLLFCLLYGGTCLWLLGQAIRTNPEKAAVPAVQNALPGPPDRPVREKKSLPPALQHKDSLHLQKNRVRRNAFTLPAESRRLRDSHLQARPGWQDSINNFE